MKLVDLTERISDVSPKYIGVPQPMVVYHSTEELFEYVEHPSIISNIFEFQEYTNGNKFTEWHNVFDHNIWLATGEKAIPEEVDIYGNVTYRLIDNKPIRTDNCYIRLNSLQSFKYNYLLWTSSGIYNVSLASWDISAGIKTQFMKTKIGKASENIKPYEERLNAVLKRKSTAVRDMQVLMLLINPLSDTFLNVDACMLKVYPEIRKKDRKKYLNTERFRNLFVNQLGKLMPELIKGVQEHNTPDDIGKYIALMRKHALEKGTTEDQIKALNVSLKIGYADQILHSGNDMSALEDNKFTPLVTTMGNTPALPENQSTKVAGTTQVKIIDESKNSDEDTVVSPPANTNELESYDDADVEENEEEYRKHMKEVGGLDAFVLDETEEDNE